MSIPEKDRTPAQKRLAKGLKITLKIAWEEVAEAVAANPGRSRGARASEAGDSRDGADTCRVRRRRRWR